MSEFLRLESLELEENSENGLNNNITNLFNKLVKQFYKFDTVKYNNDGLERDFVTSVKKLVYTVRDKKSSIDNYDLDELIDEKITFFIYGNFYINDLALKIYRNEIKNFIFSCI